VDGADVLPEQLQNLGLVRVDEEEAGEEEEVDQDQDRAGDDSGDGWVVAAVDGEDEPGDERGQGGDEDEEQRPAGRGRSGVLADHVRTSSLTPGHPLQGPARL